MARTEIAGFPPQTYKTLQSEARKNAISQRKIKDMGLFRANYVWWVHKKVDAIDPTSEGVKPVSGEIDGRHSWTHIGAKTPERLRVLKSVIAGLTAWSDFRFFASRGIFISDALFGDMVAQGMSGFAADSVWSEV